MIVYTVINKCLVVAACGHMRSAATADYIAHWSYMRGVHLKRKLKYTENIVGVVADQLLHHHQYMRQ